MRREGCNALLRTSTVTLPAPALRPAPPSTVTPRCPFSCSTVPPRCFLPLLFALRPALPDGVGTATLMRGEHSLGRQLATEVAVKGEASGPGMEALRSRLLLRLRHPMPMAEEAARRYDACCKYTFQIFQRYMLQVFHKDIAK
jgi:hypothetical protein